MVRAPCCEKMGLKKGPWTPEEDQVLIAYIQRYGHGNWRALPKQAGLLRCGKSCRLRWTNYLRPDIKRGNFSREEEDAIINLHEMLGNRWSAIAAKLPGRTDNEIKNVWHTHLKKRLKQQNDEDAALETETSKCDQSNMTADLETTNSLHDDQPKTETTTSYVPVSPQQSSSDLSGTDSSVVTGENHDMITTDSYSISESSLLGENQDMITTDSYSISESSLLEIDNFLWDFPLPTMDPQLQSTLSFNGSSNVDDNGMDFWYDLFMKADGVPELPDEP